MTTKKETFNLPTNLKELEKVKGTKIKFRYRGCNLEGIIRSKTMDFQRTCILLTKSDNQDMFEVDGKHLIGFNDYMIENLEKL